MAIEKTDAQTEQACENTDVDAVRRAVLSRLETGQHTALVVGEGLREEGALLARVFGSESESGAHGSRRIGSVRLMVIDCGLYPQPLGALGEAQRRVDELLGEGRSGSQVAADRVLAGLRRRLIGDLGEPPPHLGLLLSLEKLGSKSVSSGFRWALAFTRVERADADSVHELSQLLRRRLSVPLLVLFGSPPQTALTKELQRALQQTGGDGALIECAKSAEAKTTPKPSLPVLPARVLAVLRAVGLTGAGCELSLLVDLLGLHEDEVLQALQEASDAGIQIIDDGHDHFELKKELAELLTAQMLPSVVRSYHRRLAALLSDRLQPVPTVGVESTTKTSSPSATTAVLAAVPTAVLGSADTPDIRSLDGGAVERLSVVPPTETSHEITPEVAAAEPVAPPNAGTVSAPETTATAQTAMETTAPAESVNAPPTGPALSQVLASASQRTPATQTAPDPSAPPSAIPAEVPLYADALPPTLHWPYGGRGPQAAQPSSAGQVPAQTSSPTEPSKAKPSPAPVTEATPTQPQPQPTGSPAPDREWADRRSQAARAARHLVEAGEVDPGIERYLHAVDQALRVGAIREALTLADRAMRLLGELPDSTLRRSLRIRALCAVGRIRWLGNGPDERFTLPGALVAFQEARSLLRPTDAPELRAMVVSQLAGVLYEIGDLPSLEAALSELSEASRMLLAQGAPAMAARLLNDQAAVYVRIGDPVRAAHLLEESRRFFASGRFPSDDEEVAIELAETEHQLARLPLHVAARQGRQLDAIALGRAHAQEAAATFKRLGMRRELAHVTETLGRLETMAGRHEAAMAYLSTAAQIGRELHDLLGLARTTAAMSDVLVAAGQLQGAIELLAESLALNVEKGSLIGLAFVRRSIEKLAQRVKITASTEAPTSRALARLYDDLLAAEEQLGRAKLPSDA